MGTGCGVAVDVQRSLPAGILGRHVTEPDCARAWARVDGNILRDKDSARSRLDFYLEIQRRREAGGDPVGVSGVERNPRLRDNVAT